MTINIIDYRNFSISDIKDGIAQKTFTIKDVLQACFQTYNCFEKNINAWEEFIEFDEDIEKSMLASNSNLLGVPFGAKDIINTKNFKTEMGSKIWKNHKAGNNARVVSRLLNAGGILVGKTVTSEFAVDAKNKTKNPWDLNKIPGTSSSGSAAAVASGMVPFSIGTQTLGSIIRPASWCGVYGMKPTYGLIPRTGILKTTDTLDTVGFFTRSVEDMHCLLNETVLNDNNHPIIRENLNNQEKPNSDVKIGYLKLNNSLNDKKLKNFINKLSKIENCYIKEIKLPNDLLDGYHFHEHVYNSGLSYYFEEEIKNNYNDLSFEFLDRVIKAKKYNPKDYFKILEKQEDLAKKIEIFFNKQDIDYIICLSSNATAPIEEEKHHRDYNYLWTMTYLPVINIPHLVDEDNMPFGISLIGKKYNDFNLLKLILFFTKKSIFKKKAMVSYNN